MSANPFAEDRIMDETTVKIVDGVIAVLLVVVILLRRKSKNKDSAGDDF